MELWRHAVGVVMWRYEGCRHVDVILQSFVLKV